MNKNMKQHEDGRFKVENIGEMKLGKWENSKNSDIVHCNWPLAILLLA